MKEKKMKLFTDRAQAGHLLSQLLINFSDRQDVLVMGISRSGVAIASEIAHTLNIQLANALPMDVPADGVAAITLDDGTIEFMPDGPIHLGSPHKGFLVSDDVPHDFRNLTVILIDDCMITGGNMQRATEVLEHRDCPHIIAAAPVATEAALAALENIVEEVYCVFTATSIDTPAQLYENYPSIGEMECGMMLSTAPRHQFMDGV
jgi:putative phosphoribosyl transferase